MEEWVAPDRQRAVPTWARALLVVFLLYLFLAGVKGLESGIKDLGSGFTDDLLASVSNPLAGLFVGILATVLVQSSSVTTATVVGLVGAGTLSVDLAVPMVMGANIGTTVTNTLASLGYLRRSAEFRRAFAGATMHDFFNVISVAILLPIELTTHVLSDLAARLTSVLRSAGQLGVEQPDSPIKAFVKLPVALVESLVKRLHPSDTVLGVVLIVFGVGLIFLALAFITRNMRVLVVDRIERSLNAVLARGGGLPALALGLVMTVAVQSSSITTSVMVPLIAAGVLTLRNAYPVTLGANVGTTVTALLASLATDRPEGLTIALVHTLFNVAGILLLYPVPALRDIPVRLAQGLARVAEIRKSLVIVYVVGMFVIVPLVGILALS